ARRSGAGRFPRAELSAAGVERCAARRGPSRAFGFAALPPHLRVSGGDRRAGDLGPVECHVRILRLERAPYFIVERHSPYSYIRRRAVPVEDARTRFPFAVGDRLDEIEVFVAALVARKTEERHATASCS